METVLSQWRARPPQQGQAVAGRREQEEEGQPAEQVGRKEQEEEQQLAGRAGPEVRKEQEGERVPRVGVWAQMRAKGRRGGRGRM